MQVDTPRFPVERRDPLRPAPEYEQWRHECPVHRVRLWDDSVAWLVTGFEDARAVVRDEATFRADPATPGFPTLSARDHVTKVARALNQRDAPEHTLLRRVLSPEFLVRRVDAMRPSAERIADAHLDRMSALGGSADFVVAFARPVPAEFTCSLLGIPSEDSDILVLYIGIRNDGSSGPDETQRGIDEINGYFERLVADRLQTPRDDLSGRLVDSHVRNGVISTAQAVSLLHSLLVGGLDSMQNMLSLSLVTLLEHADQLELLRRHPGLWPNAVEELLRFLSVTVVVRRVAVAEVDVGGQRLVEGDGVLIPLDFVNRDPTVFSEPDRFDIQRDDVAHVAFGFGVHQCIGQPLVRVVLPAALGRLIERFPTLRLGSDVSELPFKTRPPSFRLESLPVRW
jgi:cytochrome P450